MKYKISYTNRFKKALRQCQKRGYDMELFRQVAEMLENTGTLPSLYSPHKLSGKYVGIMGMPYPVRLATYMESERSRVDPLVY